MAMMSQLLPRLLYMLLGLVALSEGFLNLYLNSTETRRLLGIEGDLYYVRNGTVNEYALTFNLLIRPEHNRIYFNWQNLRPPGSYPMPYSLSMTIDPDHLDPPVPNIPLEGTVPTTTQVFSVYLGCAGAKNMEVNVKILMTVAIYSVTNTTTLEIKRRKTCTDGGNWFENNTTDKVSRKMSTPPTNIFYIAVGCACGLILLVALAVAVYYVRSSKTSHGERMSDTSSSKGLTTQTTASFLRPDTPSQSVASLPLLKRGFSLSELKPSDVLGLLGEIQIQRSQISLGEVVMEGTFGRIYHGTLAVAEDDESVAGGEEEEVLIKMVADTPAARREQVEVMCREGCLLKGLASPNLLPVVAACLDDDLRTMLVYRYGGETNLKKFLLRCQVSDMGPHQALSTQQFVYLAIQISRGLQYLHRRRITHKDIACRNCVVDSQWAVRVTDNALSRDLFPNDYHCLGDNENRPIKWLATEALQERRYSAPSDVWSFGVLLWELMMMGQQPYADVDPFEMATYLREGYRISQPHNCPDELFAVMACCWSINVEERPKISQLQLCLQDFYQALGRFV